MMWERTFFVSNRIGWSLVGSMNKMRRFPEKVGGAEPDLHKAIRGTK